MFIITKTEALKASIKGNIFEENQDMRLTPALLFLPILFFSCYSVERDCERFHTGTFQFQQFIGQELKTSTFLRSEDLEIEYFESNIDSASIRWINPCECILTKINPTSNQDKRPIAIKIITTKGNDYVFEYALVGEKGKKQRGTITKLSDALVVP